MDAHTSLDLLKQLDGFVCASLVDSESSVMLAAAPSRHAGNLEVASSINAELMRAKRRLLVGSKERDEIEDIVITHAQHYHLLRPVSRRPTLFFFVCLDRTRANLARARLLLGDIERDLDASSAAE